MIFHPMRIAGAWRIEPERQADERGWFARTYCAEEFARRGLQAPAAQSSLSFNTHRGTLRGLHWQQSPHAEAKLVHCVQGTIWDVVADVRESSPTYGEWEGVELDTGRGESLYLPDGVAHGFLTLTPASLVHYQISTAYSPGASRGLRWDDPAFSIRWPIKPRVISRRDRRWPDWIAPLPDARVGKAHAPCR